MGGGGYDAGPGRSGMPMAAEMDRPPSPTGAFGRTGSDRGNMTRAQRRIQDAPG